MSSQECRTIETKIENCMEHKTKINRVECQECNEGFFISINTCVPRTETALHCKKQHISLNNACEECEENYVLNTTNTCSTGLSNCLSYQAFSGENVDSFCD